MKKKLISFLTLLCLLASPANANTTYYSYALPTVGASQNVWGTLLNTVFTTIDSDIWSASFGTDIGVNAPSASGSNITLTNPIYNVQNISFTGTGKALILPAMNATYSPVVGGVFYVNNVGSYAFEIFANDGTTAVVSSLAAGTTAVIQLLTNSTANGTFQAIVISPPSVTGPNSSTSGDIASFNGIGGNVLKDSGLAASASTITFSGSSSGTGIIGVASNAGSAVPFIIPTTTGTSGYVLETDGFGNTSWNAIPSGSGTVSSGTANQLAYYGSSGTVVSGTTALPNGTTATTQSAGDTSSDVATDAFVNPGCSLSGNGYCKLPSGLYIEWGSGSASSPISGTTTTVSFPHSCPNSFLSGTVTPNFAPTGNSGWTIQSVSASSMTIGRMNTSQLDSGVNFLFTVLCF